MTDTHAPVHVVPYDPTWPDSFERERACLAKALAPWLVGQIEHVGSTAVPGLAAKPVIDIMAPVRDLDSSRPALEVLRQCGYVYVPYRDDVMHWLCKPSRAHRTHHLHLVPFAGELWFDRLAFRDFLRANPAVAAEYANLKHRLATQHTFDREAYTEAKLPFVEYVLGHDVPSPIDLRDPIDASTWTAEADGKRPWRARFRTEIAELLRASSPPVRRVLELGSGPGLLAEAILRTCALESYTLFDFSAPMLDMSRERVEMYPAAKFVLGDFKEQHWPETVGGPFDAVIAMQAVHEIRHKRRVPGLYRRIFELLAPGGLLLVCDHTPPDDSPRSSALHSTEVEHHAMMIAAGFFDVKTHMSLGGLYLCSARGPSNAP